MSNGSFQIDVTTNLERQDTQTALKINDEAWRW